ncbi:hypothetical protein M0805_008061 [Coniferiporia weirii]|nr:hypothetical protein M0805_008061 [Coniferiporia weirii]
MIPLTRRSTSRKLETALLSCSRQSLPRPARLYSTPSKRSQAPALATAPTPLVPEFPPFVTKSYVAGADSGVDSNSNAEASESLHTFLRRRAPYTLLPTPLPDDTSSALNSYYFSDSPTQDSLAVIDACLHGCYDVPRAKYVFNQLREKRQGESILQPRLYNHFFETYLEMALEKDVEEKTQWLEEAWSLFKAMESGEEKTAPIASTYAVMLKIWIRTNSAENSLDIPSESSPSEILRNIINRHISVTTVVADRVLSSKDAADIVQHLSRAAAELGLTRVITELGQVETIAADPLKDVPEASSIPLTSGLSEEALRALSEEQADVDEELPFNIANLRKHLAEVAYAQRVLPDDVAARQKLLEASVYDLAVQRLRHEAEKLDEAGVNAQKLQAAQLQTWMFDWHEKLQKRLTSEIEMLIEEEAWLRPEKKDTTIHMRLAPFLSLLKPEKLSLITILELMRLQGTGGVAEGMKTARALLTVGRAVEMEYKAEILKKNNIHVPQVPSRPNDSSYFTRRAYEELQEWRKKAADFTEESGEWTSEWSHSVRARVGSCLVDCLMDVATVKRTAVDKRTGEEVVEEHPAFYHSYEYLRGHKLGVIRLNPTVADRLSKDDIRATLHPRHLPMLIRPKPWISHDEGGYIYNKGSVMRLKDTQEQLTYLRHASSAGHMEHVFAGLDVLGSTPWVVNRDIFDVVLEVWNSGKRFCKIPAAQYDVPEPVKPDNFDDDVLAKSQYLVAWRQWQLDRANNHSGRCSVNYKVEIARSFLADTMYLPHNIDFRGRAYPIPPHLNHVGDDLSRGLLKFAESKPLGASGLRWLKIHLANLYGYDKGSFEERVQFVNEHLADIYDSAERPLEGNRWWVRADDPWQCLATCKELHKALESGDPEAFESNLPVHQDGTCNGLQHYAALGGDMKGAQQVNLDVTDRPADVYTHVAQMVEEVVKKDAEKGEKYAQLIQGKITRKVVKQTVMTTVYGVTYIGAREQIEKQLRDRGDIPANEAWNASAYLARNVIGCIGDLFSGAKRIQDWLTLSARLIAKSIPLERVEMAISEDNVGRRGKKKIKPQEVDANGQLIGKKIIPQTRMPKEQMTSVVWTTPLGLPIVQPYRKVKRRQIMTSIQTVFISDPNTPSEVNATKQATAFPPNFIHSLDATHMMLTALECSRHDLSFASVHDSYWTHASTIDKMSEIIRETFIALHESNVLKRLHKEFLDRYKDYKVPLISLRSKSILGKLALPEARALLAQSPEIMAQLEALEDEVDTDDLDANLAQAIDAAVAEVEASDAVESGVVQPTEPASAEDGMTGTLTTESVDRVESADQKVVELIKRKRGRPRKNPVEKDPRPIGRPPKGLDWLTPAGRVGLKSAEGVNNMDAAAKAAYMRKQVMNRFVNLVDVLPPLPKKGDFDVQRIKQSKYFFS